MGAKTLERSLGSLQYDPGRTTKLSLPREHWYEYLNLVMEIDADVDSSVSPTRTGMGELDLIENVKVEYNGSHTPKSTSFATSHLVDYYEYGSRPVYEQFDLSTTSTQTARAQTFVQFLMAPRNMATPLPSFRFSTLDLEIKWADESAITENGDGLTINNAECRVQTRERKRSAVPKEKQALRNLMVFKEKEVLKEISSTGETQIDLPTGNVYHSVPTLVLDNGSPTDSLIEQIEIVENGVDTHKAKDWDLQQDEDYAQYAIEEPETGFAFPGYAVGAEIDDVVDSSGMDSYHYVLDTGDNSPTDAHARLTTRELIVND